ncbi:MAG: OmpH family outer membrane protein [Planctomycetes bacterium]|nr:OmpH family outer membrane protein [Planctomycetota bacterium]
MKFKTMFLSCLTGMIILAMGYEYSQAQQKADTPSSKIGIVSILKIFRNCKRSATHKRKITAEQNKIRAELEILSKQLIADKGMLDALKQDSSDYLAQHKEFIKKRASFETQQTINKEQRVLKEYKWSKELYKDILQITCELAEQKGLDVVLEKNEIDIPALSVNEFNQTINTHKVLYSGGCIDITDEVMARLDKGE